MLRPKAPTDLTLAPVAAGIDLNLQRLRDLETADEIVTELALELNVAGAGRTREERVEQVMRVALRDVDLHGWHADVSEDASRIHLHGGSVTLDVGLSAALERYIAG
jgi:hypothetical protein